VRRAGLQKEVHYSEERLGRRKTVRRQVARRWMEAGPWASGVPWLPPKMRREQRMKKTWQWSAARGRADSRQLPRS
jgi:hypothetical protein